MLDMSETRASNLCSKLLAKSTEVGSGLTYQCQEMKKFVKIRNVDVIPIQEKDME